MFYQLGTVGVSDNQGNVLSLIAIRMHRADEPSIKKWAIYLAQQFHRSRPFNPHNYSVRMEEILYRRAFLQELWVRRHIVLPPVITVESQVPAQFAGCLYWNCTLFNHQS